MLNTLGLFIFVAVLLSSAKALDEADSFDYQNRNCNLDRLKPKVRCSDLGSSVEIGGGLYTNHELHFNLLASPYYFGRMADALGYECPANKTLLKLMDLMTPWSGQFGAIALDGAFGYERVIGRHCIFPTTTHPFLCSGIEGTPGTNGKLLGTLSYISLLHDNKEHKWTLFGHCWNAKTPENPHAREEATSWNVFSLGKTLSKSDKLAIVTKLAQVGFDVSAENIITPDYTKISV